MVKLTLWLDCKNTEIFTRIPLWKWIEKNIINRAICIAFKIEEVEDVV